MEDRRGLRIGLAVRDAAGNTLGKIRRVYGWGFEVNRGFWSPYTWVFRNEEVLRVGSGVVDVARSPDDLLRLASGELPSSWRRGTPAPEGIPAAPQEAAPFSPRAAAPFSPHQAAPASSPERAPPSPDPDAPPKRS